jgi:hypothetical protein
MEESAQLQQLSDGITQPSGWFFDSELAVHATLLAFQ